MSSRKPPPSKPPVPALSVPLSQLSSDSLLTRLGDGLQAQVLETIQGLQLFAQQRPAKEAKTWSAQISHLQRLLETLHKTCPTEATGDAEAPEVEGTLDPTKLLDFGALLCRQREAAKLSLIGLAKLAGLAKNTLINLEHGRVNPTHATVLRLLSVRELGLSREQVPWQQTAESDLASSPNCWIAPGYDPIKMFVELITLLNGHGGPVEQTYAYLDHQSALHWYSLANQSGYVTEHRENMPLGPIAAAILASTGRASIDLIALGAGDGRQEVRLALHLLEQGGELFTGHRADICLYLLDISQPLLSEAYRHAAASLDNRRGVTVWAIQGNFHHLPRFTQLHYAPERAHRRRIILMLGNTLGNLENEPSFLRHCLGGYAPGDLLLLHIDLARAPADDVEAIHRQDDALRVGVRAAHQEWLGGPLRRYCQGAAEVNLRYELETHCPVPGSYCLDAMATVTTVDKRERQFCVFRFKRYEPQGLIKLMAAHGWQSVAEFPHGMADGKPLQLLILFRKASAAATK